MALGSALTGVAAKAAASQDKPAAQEAKPVSDAESAEKLRKERQNPMASLISVPIQGNWNFNIGPNDRTQNILDVQPVNGNKGPNGARNG